MSCLTLCIIIFLGGLWTQTSNKHLVNEQTADLNKIARTQSSILERRLSTAFTSTRILAYEIEYNNGDMDFFERYAPTLSNSFDGIESLQLAPNGTIKKIFPLEGNEAAIGIDILSNTRVNEGIKTAVKNNTFIIVGPIKLVQGGSAIIGRVPVYMNQGKPNEKFWGLVSALINVNSLLKATQLQELESEGYQYTLSRNSLDRNKTILVASSKLPLTDLHVKANLMLPAQTWTLSISKTLEKKLMNNTLKGYFLTAWIALLLAIALYLLLMQPDKLKKLVKAKTAELEDLAYKDPLTNLPNRRYLQDHLPLYITNNKTKKRISAFIYFDLDNFKRINDTIGHDVGDKILIIVADRLNQLKEKSDLIIRLGGDEFGILLADIKSREDAEQKAIDIVESIRSPVKLGNRELLLSTSLGVAIIPEHGNNMITIMQNADIALYQAKLEGKNQHITFTEDMRVSTYNKIQEEHELSLAIKNNEFELYYQPQFDLYSKKIVSAEALIRWNHPKKGLIFPNDFIPLAEESGKIVELGHWVLESCIAYLAKRKAENKPEFQIHINLSSKQLSTPGLIQSVQQLLSNYKVPAKLLGFEVTETSILEDIETAKEVLKTFQDMGICISIDDFGTGYSSLAQLKNLPVSLLKIDRSFIMDLEEDLDDRKIVEAIIAMAHKLNIRVLAEGIETQAQWDMLASFYCDLGQGYLVSKAITEAELNLIHVDISKEIKTY
ncbi:EAL domain-containing protein [Marinomonas sp.]|nr:EAL domain-containing protein [Marinomonas sp.]MDB4837789.1 EAL domain-containing protein [Marinomonas sp.]